VNCGTVALTCGHTFPFDISWELLCWILIISGFIIRLPSTPD